MMLLLLVLVEFICSGAPPQTNPDVLFTQEVVLSLNGTELYYLVYVIG